MVGRFKKEKSQEPQQPHSPLEMSLLKLEIVERAIREIEGLPEMSRAHTLLDSILHELSSMRHDIHAYLLEEQDHRQHLSEEKEQQLQEQNYVVEFYDGKIKHQESIIRDLEVHNDRLRHEGEVNRQELGVLENELLSVRGEIEELAKRSKNKDVAESDLLMTELDSLLEELREKDRVIESLTKEVQGNRDRLERQARQEHASFSYRLLDVNKTLDSNKVEFMKLIRDLETDRNSLKKENLEAMDRMIVNELRVQELELKLAHKTKELAERDSKVQTYMQEVETIRREGHKKVSTHSEALKEKQLEQTLAQERLDKMQESLFSLQTKLKSKVEEISLLEKENCKLHEFLCSRQNQITDKQRSVAMASLKGEQEKKQRQMVEWQLQQLKNEISEVTSKLDLATRFKTELEKDRQDKIRVLQEVNHQLNEYDLKFSRIRDVQTEKEEEIRKYIHTVKKEYEDVISKLVVDCRALDSALKQSKAEVANKNSLIQAQSSELSNERREVIAFKSKSQENTQIESRHRETQAECLLLQEEVENLKKILRDSQARADHIHQLKSIISELQSDNEELQLSHSLLNEKSLSSASKSQKQIKQLEGKVWKLGETLSQKQFEVVEGTTKNKGLVEEISTMKRNAMLERTRLETRLNELQKVLKEKRNFEAKVNSLVC